MTREGFQLEQNGRVGIIRLARPPVNAVTFDLLDRLAEVVVAPDRAFPAATALVIAADGPHFSAGMDGVELDNLDRDRLTRAASALGSLLRGQLPLVAAVHGSAVGTGFILAACADLLVIDPDAEVWLPETELGMLGGAGHARRWLPGPLVARMVLAGERLKGLTLHRFGAIAPAPGETTEQTALAHANRLGDLDPAVVAEARKVLAGLGPDAAEVHRQEMANTPFPTKPEQHEK